MLRFKLWRIIWLPQNGYQIQNKNIHCMIHWYPIFGARANWRACSMRWQLKLQNLRYPISHEANKRVQPRTNSSNASRKPVDHPSERPGVFFQNHRRDVVVLLAMTVISTDILLFCFSSSYLPMYSSILLVTPSYSHLKFFVFFTPTSFGFRLRMSLLTCWKFSSNPESHHRWILGIPWPLKSIAIMRRLQPFFWRCGRAGRCGWIMFEYCACNILQPWVSSLMAMMAAATQSFGNCLPWVSHPNNIEIRSSWLR